MDVVNANEKPLLIIQRIYRRTSSFEIFNFSKFFKQSFQPENQLQINIQTKALEQDVYEMILAIEVTVKHKNKALFKGELKQAGIFPYIKKEQQVLSAHQGIFL